MSTGNLACEIKMDRDARRSTLEKLVFLSAYHLVGTVHGVGAFLILLGGFGMLARMGFLHGSNFPGWLWAKIVIWALLSAIVLLPYRKAALARPFIVLLPLLAGVAVYMALYKPV
jgi:hypothetical protein